MKSRRKSQVWCFYLWSDEFVISRQGRVSLCTNHQYDWELDFTVESYRSTQSSTQSSCCCSVSGRCRCHLLLKGLKKMAQWLQSSPPTSWWWRWRLHEIDGLFFRAYSQHHNWVTDHLCIQSLQHIPKRFKFQKSLASISSFDVCKQGSNSLLRSMYSRWLGKHTVFVRWEWTDESRKASSFDKSGPMDLRQLLTRLRATKISLAITGYHWSSRQWTWRSECTLDFLWSHSWCYHASWYVFVFVSDNFLLFPPVNKLSGDPSE